MFTHPRRPTPHRRSRPFNPQSLRLPTPPRKLAPLRHPLLSRPDLFMLGYTISPKIGATTYNLAHTLTLPLALLLAAYIQQWHFAEALALIWTAHIAFDRLLGYGLKYPTFFKDTPPPAHPLKKYFQKEENFRHPKNIHVSTTFLPQSTTFSPQKKPRLAPCFSQNPLVKQHSTTPDFFWYKTRECDNRRQPNARPPPHPAPRHHPLRMRLTIRPASATHIPANVRTLAVPIFATNAQAYHTEMAFTQATIRELNTRTKYHIINNDSDSADATLHGTILTQSVAPLT